MISTKPYLIRAIREWATDNDLTPQILVDATIEGVIVPQSHVSDGQIVLNISDSAVELKELGNDFLAFSARFNGQAFNVDVPVNAVLAIFARENGQGIFFQDPENTADETSETAQVEGEEAASTKPNPPHLKLVK